MIRKNLTAAFMLSSLIFLTGCFELSATVDKTEPVSEQQPIGDGQVDNENSNEQAPETDQDAEPNNEADGESPVENNDEKDDQQAVEEKPEQDGEKSAEPEDVVAPETPAVDDSDNANVDPDKVDAGENETETNKDEDKTEQPSSDDEDKNNPPVDDQEEKPVDPVYPPKPVEPEAQINKFIKTKGTQLIGLDGQPLFLSGINLGNWLLWEGYLMMGDFNFRTHTQFLESLTTVFGSEQRAREFEHQWRLNYVDDTAIAELAALGFNSVRVPFHYNMFWQQGQLSHHGFQYFDRVIESARTHGIYVLLDMHAAPGYQNPGDHADNVNSNDAQPRNSVTFWDGTENIEIAAKVWRHIAEYYKDEPVVWGYDLFNEPVPQDGREMELLPSLIKIRDAIREVDNNHIIVAEGSWWSSDLTKIDWADPLVQQATGVTSQWDDKLVYQIHHYGAASGTFGREAITNKLNIPLIIGEYGESDYGNLKQITDWSKRELAGYFPWSFKKMSHDKTLWTIKPNEAYNELKKHIVNNTRAADSLYQEMIKFAQNNIKNGAAHLEWDKGFYDAVKPDLQLKKTCDIISLPSYIEAEDFCQQDGIQTEVTSDVGGGENVGWVDAGDWLEFKLANAESQTYDFSARIASEIGTAGFKVIVGDSVLTTVPVPKTGGWQQWQTVIEQVTVPKGTQNLRIEFIDQGINLNWFAFQ